MKNLLLILFSFSYILGFSQSTNELYQRAATEIQAENFKEAVRYLDLIIKDNNKAVQAYSFRAYVKNILKDYKGAIADFTKIIELEPNNSYAYDKRGICKKNSQDYAGALKDYNKAIELDDQSAAAYSNRGVLKYNFLGDKEGGCEDWAIAKKLGHQIAFINSEGKCEEKIGALKTQDGILIYFNEEGNYHTLAIKGDVDISNFPLIKQNDTWFQLVSYLKSEFEGYGKDALTNFMDWEQNHIKKEFGNNIQFENTLVQHHQRNLNLWNHEIPQQKEVKRTVKKVFHADFVDRTNIYRLIYSSESGNEQEANNLLKSLVDQLTFYNNKIDLSRLRHAISNGVNHYVE